MVNGVERLFEVDGRHPEWQLPFVAALVDDGCCEEVICCTVGASKSSLVGCLVAVEMCLQSVVEKSCKELVEQWYDGDGTVVVWI